LFQTIVGAWPLGLTAADKNGLAAYSKRIAAWQQKALREAKLHSDWAAPNDAYEGAAADVIARLFSTPSPLLAEIADFAGRIAPHGAANGLAQVLAKLTVPGVPDIYQGTEYWDLSLVDPDNRSPVDFAARQKTLNVVSCNEAAKNWTNGAIKQYLIARILAVRKKLPRLFAEGTYIPLEAIGPLAEHVVAFARTLPNSAAIGVFCRCSARLLGTGPALSIPASRWKDTRLVIPTALQGQFSDEVTQQTTTIGPEIAVAQILPLLPIALLTKQDEPMTATVVRK